MSRLIQGWTSHDIIESADVTLQSHGLFYLIMAKKLELIIMLLSLTKTGNNHLPVFRMRDLVSCFGIACRGCYAVLVSISIFVEYVY